jgi:hemerythrin
MDAFTWSNDYKVHIAQIDSQHRHLVALVGRLMMAMKEGKGNDILGRILAEVISYTQTHFDTEEKLLWANAYPGYAAHQQEHATLTKQVRALHERFQKKEVALTIEVAQFLKDWLIKHILGTDKNYSQFLLSKGVR